MKIIEGMRGHTSGLAIPLYVIDLPQGGGKVPVQPNYILIHTQQELVLKNYQNRIFHYRNPENQVGRKKADKKAVPTNIPVDGLLNTASIKL
jgi:lysine 2,3-aminomutase